MSSWLYKLDDRQHGPVSFRQLADLVREGNVTEGALVCREGTMKWEPAWHVPGLLRAAGIVEPGDSPLVEERERQSDGARQREGGLPTLPGYVLPENQQPSLTFADVVRGAIAAAVGLLAVGFFYRWACQTTVAFPARPTVVEGELIDCCFPIIGPCTSLECGLLYIDVFWLAAAAAWHAARKNRIKKWGTEI